MYLISLYFDDEANKRIQRYIHNVAEKSGNRYMVERNVPPHMTISAFETLEEKRVVEVLEDALSNIKQDKIEWVTVGAFPSVIYIQPVLNEYLHNMSCTIYDSIVNMSGIKVGKYYKPFSWIPHMTIAKQLSEEEMQKAFDMLHNSFGVFEGKIVRIELAKKNPYRVIARWKLKDE